ncbi:hypothetical protein ACLOJK_012295 [Asimina triloba]
MTRLRYSASRTVSLLPLAAGLSSPIEYVCLGTSPIRAPPSLMFSESSIFNIQAPSSLTFGDSPIFNIPPGRFRCYLDDTIAGSLSSPIFCICSGRWPVPPPPPPSLNCPSFFPTPLAHHLFRRRSPSFFPTSNVERNSASDNIG